MPSVFSIRVAAMMCSLLPFAMASSADTFVDRDGARHPWSITDTNVLVWDGHPYIPFGGMYVARAFWQDGDAVLTEDKARLSLVRENGVDDLYLNPCRAIPMARLQQVIEILEELGFKYGVQLCHPLTGDMPGYSIQPEELVTSVDGPGTHELEAGACTRGWYIVCAAHDGQLIASGQVEAKDGRFQVAFDAACPGGAVIKVIPETTAKWGSDEHTASITDYLAEFRPGPGLRFFIDPIGNEYNTPRFFLPRAESWRAEFATFLSQRYDTPAKLAQAWGLREADLPGFLEAARLVPMVVGDKDSDWSDTGYVVDDASGGVFPVDIRKSRMWADICEARERAIQSRLNMLCDAIKSVHDVPVIAKRHYESTRIWCNPNESGGLDGLGMESYIKGERLASFNGAGTYADVVQAKRPMWCLVTEYNGATWTDRHITYKTRAEMYSDIELLLSLGAKGVFMFGLGLSGSDGDLSWTIYELLKDPRQIEWLGTYGAIAESRTDWLRYTPDTAFWYPAQNTDAKAFAPADLPDYGLSGSWSGVRSVLKLGDGRWVAPVYTTDVPGPIVYPSAINEWPCFKMEADAVRALPRNRRYEADTSRGPKRLPDKLIKDTSSATEFPLRVSVWAPGDGIEGVEWRGAEGTPHISLRATGAPVTANVSSTRVGEVQVQLPGQTSSTAASLPLSVALPGAALRTQGFTLSNPGFGVNNVKFECEVGDKVPCLTIIGADRNAIEISASPDK